jgi:hypothetical protein
LNIQLKQMISADRKLKAVNSINWNTAIKSTTNQNERLDESKRTMGSQNEGKQGENVDVEGQRKRL